MHGGYAQYKTIIMHCDMKVPKYIYYYYYYYYNYIYIYIYISIVKVI